MPRRLRARLAALAAIIVATLGLTVGTAAAGTSYPPPPFNGACSWSLNWADNYLQWTIHTTPPYYSFCGNRYQVVWRCGTWSNPNVVDIYSQVIDETAPPSHTHNSGPTTCAAYGLATTNVVIAVKVWGSLNVCWQVNAANWVYNRTDVPCVGLMP